MIALVSQSVRTILMAVIRVYQVTLSPLFPASCRFVPTCSDYALEALQRKGVFEALWLVAGRLGRCHPLCRGGFDPVPPDRMGTDGAVRPIVHS
jgi:hypothetical protein